MECSNYRGITLLNAAYKVFANILYRRLLPYAEEHIGEYQCGFRNDRSTTDQLFNVRQIMEKCREFTVTTHHLFVDFKAAYDSVVRAKLWSIMEEFGFPTKLVALTKLTLSNVKSVVRIRGQLSLPFETEEGLRQGDPLATLLFNIVLEKAIRNTDVDTRGTIFMKSKQLLAYADDVDIVGRSIDAVKDTFTALKSGAAPLGLKVNESKTVYMVAPQQQNSPDHVTIDEERFEVVKNFKYLGSEINSTNDIGEEIKNRIASGNRSYYGLIKLFKSKTLNKQLKCKLYRQLVRPVVTYGSEAWCMTLNNELCLRVFEKKILRAIFGPTNDQGRWRRRYDFELKRLYKEQDIISFIKVNRLRWVGHVVRMGDCRVPKKLFETNPEGTRGRGRPKGRWKDAVTKDLSGLRVRNWRSLAVNRDRWRSLLREAKADSRL